MLSVALPALVSLVPPQEAAPAGPITVELRPGSLAEGALGWSPKGAKVPLVRQDAALGGSLALGPDGTSPVAVRLLRSQDAPHFDLLELDRDRDGQFGGEGERLTTKPSERNGKWWSSFSAELSVPLPPGGDGTPVPARPYPLALWYVEDPQEPEAEPVLRWSRRGWHEGQATIAGQPAFVLVTEMAMDGVFDQRDAWAITRDRKTMLSAAARTLEQHVWLDGKAWRAVAIDPHGRSLSFAPFDPGTSEADEKARSDIHAADRAAPRAEQPLAFGQDLPAALDRAAREGKQVLVDFATTWCGPCKLMDQWVWSSAAVVAAAASTVAVAVDGDQHRDLTRRYGVTAYPTIVLLAPDGSELRRAVGYRSVAQMVEFLAPPRAR